VADALLGLADLAVDVDQVVDEFDGQSVPLGRRPTLAVKTLEPQ
jgi:hypothetical protein